MRKPWEKGRVARTEEEQIALSVRILDNRHWDDVRSRALKELGDRGTTLGPLDMSRNVLASYVQRQGRAYVTPPLVTGGLTAELAAFVGDHSASTTVAKYATVEGRPLPTAQAQASAEALRYRLGAGYAGLLLDYDERSQRMSLEVISPDDLRLEYASTSPTEPTVIRHRRLREVRGEVKTCTDVYDLTDLDAPSWRIYVGDEDVTAAVLGEGAGAWWWRGPDGRPYHRIVITGDARNPYRTNTLVEATLSVCVAWTHWRAGVVDAGHPSRHAIGLRLRGSDSDGDTGTTGTATGPEVVHVWEHVDPERPGSLTQLGPGFDPEIVGRAIRTYEVSALSAQGLPLSMESVGGAPTQDEREAMAEVVRTTYPECRRFDAEILRRAAAMRWALGDAGLLPAATYPADYGLLYGEEVEEALDAPPAPDNTTGDDNNG